MVGLSESVSNKLEKSKWNRLLGIDQPVFHKLFIKFLSTFLLAKGLVAYDKPNFVQF